MSNCKHNHTNKHADTWTNIAAIGGATASLISDSYWIASLIDTTFEISPNLLGLSYYGMGFGIAAAILSAGGATYSHRGLDTLHQPETDANRDIESGHTPCQPNENVSLLSTPKLTAFQKLALIGDFISHTGDIAGPFTFVANLATNNKLPLWGKLATQCGATFFGGLASVSGVRNCKDAMLKNNQTHCHHPINYTPK